MHLPPSDLIRGVWQDRRPTPEAQARCIRRVGALAVALMSVVALRAATEWTEYLGGPSRACYSPLTEITPANVSQLRVAWEYHSGDPGQTECNPIIVDGVLYGTTATNQVFAIDAATGKELWRFREEGHDVGSNER